MSTVNRQISEASISHSVDLQQYANGVVYKIIALLNSVDADILAQLATSLEKMPQGSFNAKRLDVLLKSIRELNSEAFEAIQRELTPELKALTALEAGYQYELFNATIPQAVTAQIAVNAINVEQVYTAAISRPFQGRLLSEWMADLEESRAKRIRDAVRMGYVENQTIPQIVQRVKGTRANKYSDGILQIDRRNAEAVVRTAVSHMAAETNERFLEKNDDLINGLIWDAKLDTKTTHICIARDGKKYANITHKPIGHNLPWLGGAGKAHWNSVLAGTPVHTNRGIVSIENVVIGDEVLTHKGRYKAVSALLSKDCDSGVVRVVHTKSGRILRASDDHPILTARGGWKFVGALKIGDELIGNDEGFIEVINASSFVNSKSENSPAVTDDAQIALQRTIRLISPAVDFKGDFEVWAGEVENSRAEYILGNPELIKSDECAQHHLLALSQVVSECGRNGLSELLSGLLGHGNAFHSSGERNKVTALGVGFCGFLRNTFHVHGIFFCHSFGMIRVNDAGFFGHAKRPMSFARWMNNCAKFYAKLDLVGFVSNFNKMLFSVAGKTSVSQVKPSFDAPQRFASNGVVGVDNVKVVDFRFSHDPIVALEVQGCNKMVYDLSVNDDASYFAGGLAVSNCRSRMIPSIKTLKELGIDLPDINAKSTRASMDGQVDADITYSEWIKKQSYSRQVEVLGVKRAKLMRDGDLSVEDFVNDKGIFINLTQLKERNARAFAKAGI